MYSEKTSKCNKCLWICNNLFRPIPNKFTCKFIDCLAISTDVEREEVHNCLKLWQKGLFIMGEQGNNRAISQINEIGFKWERH